MKTPTSFGAAEAPAFIAQEEREPAGDSWSLVKTYWPFYGLVFLIGTENFIVSPFIPDMARSIEASVGALATVVTAYALTYAFSAPLLGQLTDRVGTRPLITVGISIFLVGNVLFAIGSSLGFLQISRAITGLGGAAAGPAIWSHIAGNTRADLRGRAMGLGMGAFALGQVAGLPLGAIIASAAGWRWVFGGIGALMLPLLTSCFIYNDGFRASTKAQASSRFPLFSVWASPVIVSAFAGTFLFQIGNLGAYTYLGSLLLTQFALSTAQIGSIGIFVGGGSFLGSFVGGKLNDYWHRRGGNSSHLAAFWSLILAVAVFAATGKLPFFISLCAVTLWFIASGAYVTTQLASITLAAPTMRASAVSWNNSIMFAGAGLGVWLMGRGLSQGISIGVVGLVFGLAASASALGCAHIQRAQQKEKRS